MPKYVVVNSDGLATAFYDDSINKVPSGAIEITLAQWQQWIDNTTGLAWSNGALVTYTPPAPSLPQQAIAALTAGVAIVSTGTPALNGTYACDTASQQKIQAISLFIVVNSKFPGGGTTYPWLDMAGGAHTFPSTAEFQAFATAVADYVASLDQVIAGATSSLPSSPVTIA